MPLPTRKEIMRRARKRFHRERREVEGIEPEEEELEEGGYVASAKTELLSSGSDRELFRLQESYLRGMASE